MSSNQSRTQFHQVIRELFAGKLETRAEDVKEGEEGSRILIKWAPKGGAGNSRASGSDRGGRGGRGRSRGGDRSNRNATDDKPPPWIHFTLQKTNRDTQDALAHISRLLRIAVKDLAVAGTKDKRGVTTQRVSLKRGPKSIEEVWQFVNAQYAGRKTVEQVMSERGERGVRVGDMTYARSSLDLGMLKGNAFVITLRNIKADSEDTINRAMQSMKDNGFINYYGMQRFGTSSIPTHTIGLALLKSDWAQAISLLLRPRPGEYSEAEAGRRAWLERGDLQAALELIPRRAVAERSILEFFDRQGGEAQNIMGALNTIPRNLRLMYVHAYQSYVWNAIVSERIRLHGASKPIVGDLVYDKNAPAPPPKKKGKYVPPNIKVLKEEDLKDYTIFDVIMPLPGRDVAYPGGELGERYKEFLRLDGLDPDNLVHTHRDYSLLGSYRHMLHLPTHLSWSIIRYTDPDIALAQSDEDQLLGFTLPPTEPDGKFMALKMELQLGTAAYATMAIREVTKTETSSYHQTNLTLTSEDQKFKGVGGEAVEGAEDPEVEEVGVTTELAMEEAVENEIEMAEA
ncbi:hypothetical protein FRC02_006318 [Tulasnella sp. 418]|nr:hypothetical protein FRC02_006318 [Tulasnella sp. 418]